MFMGELLLDSREVGRRAEKEGDSKQNKTTKIRIIFAAQLISLMAIYLPKKQNIKIHPYGKDVVKLEFSALDLGRVHFFISFEEQFDIMM